MSLLHLQIEVYADTATVNSTATVSAILSVITAEGNPVNGLTANNLVHDNFKVPPYGSTVQINTVTEIGSTGFYDLELITNNPEGTATWLKGTYINRLQVTHGNAKGQVIYKIVIN